MLCSVPLAEITAADTVLFTFTLLAVLGGLTAYFFVSFWRVDQKRGVSPYTGLPLRFANEITYASQQKVINYLKVLHDFDNRPFDFNQAAFCRETGRIFPNTVTWWGAIKIDWSFIAKRYQGHFISWGSLSQEQKKEILHAQGSLEGFQTEYSSRNPSPRLAEEAFALTKPGPLYVDPHTKIVMGWKVVPGTSFELLIVKKPQTYSLVNLEQKKT